MSFGGLSDFPAHSMSNSFDSMLLRINLEYIRIVECSPIYAAVQLASNSSSPPPTNVIFDSIQLATEVVHPSYYSRCSWPCHASLFLWLLGKLRNNILTGVEEGGLAVGTQKTSLSNFFYGSNCAGELAGRDPQEVGGDPRAEPA